MFSFILKPQYLIALFITLAALGFGWYSHSQYNRSQARNEALTQQLASSKAAQELLESAVQRWKKSADDYNKRLKSKETIVAKNARESDARVKEILQRQYSADCVQAIHQALQGLDIGQNQYRTRL